MKTIWISAIGFAAGAGIGAGATYYSVKKIFEAKADEEIAKMEAYYAKKHDELNAMEEQIKLTEDISETEKPVEEDVKAVKKAYNKLADQYNTITEEKPKKGRKKKKIEEPYVISAAEFEEQNGFDKVIVSYFEEDEVLMTDDEEVMENGSSVLGVMNLEQFGASGDGDDTVYIRNETFGTDYQVVLEDGSYRNFIENQG